MKKFLLLLASIIVICSCDKEKIDPSLVNVEIELTCIDEEPAYGGETKHTILCTGKIGGFTGEARIDIGSRSPWTGTNTKTVSVAGENTSFSYTFHVTEDDDYTNKPITFDITVSGPQYQELFRSSVVVYL